MGNIFSALGSCSASIPKPANTPTATTSSNQEILTSGPVNPAAHRSQGPPWAFPSAIIFDDKLAALECERLTESTITGPSKPLQAPKKPKTRKLLASAEPADTNPPLEPPIAEIPRITVSATSYYEVICLLYHNRASKRTFGEVKWDDLVKALVEIGFACEPVGGSSVRFSRFSDKTGSMQSVKLDHPHPGTKLWPRTARGFGKSLDEYFGLKFETFELE